MAQGRQGKRTDSRVDDFIEQRALKGYSPASILRELEQSPTLVAVAPRIRTVQKRVRDITASGGERWSVATADADEMRSVLPVLRDLSEQGFASTLTTREASLIHKFKSYDDAIPAYAAWSLTRQLLARESRGESIGTIEACLAYAPWRDGARAYAAAFQARRFDTLHYVVEFSEEAEAILEQMGQEATK